MVEDPSHAQLVSLPIAVSYSESILLGMHCALAFCIMWSLGYLGEIGVL